MSRKRENKEEGGNTSTIGLSYTVPVLLHRGCGGKLQYEDLPWKDRLELARSGTSCPYIVKCTKCGFLIRGDWIERKIIKESLKEALNSRNGSAHEKQWYDVLVEWDIAVWSEEVIKLEPVLLTSILDEAYSKVEKYKDGIKTRDTWLQKSIYLVLKELSKKNEKISKVLRYHDANHVALDIVNWAIEAGLLKVVKTVDIPIPYAYRKHGWRGIKYHRSWRVIIYLRNK